ncbi:retinol dehydrogenase 12-like [Battus philenor]|uniref:retinol dehydrogenase 12-like n=1 Tax=Battus philenor TaxID=42288 RepID=UPI0035CED7A1
MYEKIFRLYSFLQLPICIIASVAITLAVIRKCIHKTKGLCTCNTRLDGKLALITGGTSGLGFETARNLAERGAKVVVASIDETHKDAVEDIIRTSGNKNVEFIYLDLSKFKSIKEFVEQFINRYDKLDILVNNAGCTGLKHKISEDGNDMVMQINYLGPFLLTNLLLEKIKYKPSRIVMVSSLAYRVANLNVNDLSQLHTNNFYRRYANSKLCIILWTKALAQKLPEGITANVVHPGLSKTNMFRRMYPIVRFFFLLVVGTLFKTAKEGAQTTIHVCVAPEIEKVSGGYFCDCKLVEIKLPNEKEMVEAVWNKSVLLTGSELDI